MYSASVELEIFLCLSNYQRDDGVPSFHRRTPTPCCFRMFSTPFEGIERTLLTVECSSQGRPEAFFSSTISHPEGVGEPSFHHGYFRPGAWEIAPQMRYLPFFVMTLSSYCNFSRWKRQTINFLVKPPIQPVLHQVPLLRTARFAGLSPPRRMRKILCVTHDASLLVDFGSGIWKKILL